MFIFNIEEDLSNILTNPATKSPPIVPCEVIDATAILVAHDQSSALG